MERTEQVIEHLNGLMAGLFTKTVQGVEPAPPAVLMNHLLQIRSLLMTLVDTVAGAEKTFKHAKAARYDKFIKEGMKPSPASDKLKMEKDLIDLEIEAERLKHFMKYADGVCTSIQSVLRAQSAQEKNQY